MPISTLISLIPERLMLLSDRPWDTTHTPHCSLFYGKADPELAEKLHAQSAQKPFTVSPLIAKGRQYRNQLHIRAATDCKLRFTFLDDALFAAFGHAFLKFEFPTIRIGDATFQVKQFVSHAMEDAALERERKFC